MKWSGLVATNPTLDDLTLSRMNDSVDGGLNFRTIAKKIDKFL